MEKGPSSIRKFVSRFKGSKTSPVNARDGESLVSEATGSASIRTPSLDSTQNNVDSSKAFSSATALSLQESLPSTVIKGAAGGGGGMSLWQRGYNLAKSKKAHVALFEKYENVVVNRAATAGLLKVENELHQRTPDPQTRIQEVIQRSQDTIESRQWKVSCGRLTNIKIRDQLQRVAKFLQIVKDIGAAAASLDPLHAGVAWAGVSVILSVSENFIDLKTSF